MKKNRYELFLEKTGLTAEEAMVFIDLKIKELLPEKDQEPNMEYINKISKEAIQWKQKNNL